MNNNEIECLVDEDKNKFYVLKKSNLDIDNIDESFIKNNVIQIFSTTITVNKTLYYKYKLIHRENGPAIEYSDGTKEWYLNGLRHRENGPAIEIDKGRKEWYKNGELHREDGPAIEWDKGDKYWFRNGLRHRDGGPAYESIGGIKEYWIDGNQISEEKFYLEQDLRTNLKKNNLNKKNKI